MENEWIGPWQRKKRTIKYDNPWIAISHEEVINPNGGEGIYGVVHYKNLAIGIVPIDKDGHTWLVGQHRYPLNSYSWEIPEGGGPLDLDPLESAKRELIEEVGLRAESWTHILDMALSNSVSDEKAIIYVATQLTQGAAEPEETEQLAIKKLPFAEVFEMVMRGEITDSMSVAAILKVKLLLDSGKLQL
ncbi:MAG: NUDIX hydrolase [Schleiferiaceae bacterium]|nr:NUDIX hydrolase [Schleiferiaceae bacterium]